MVGKLKNISQCYDHMYALTVTLLSLSVRWYLCISSFFGLFFLVCLLTSTRTVFSLQVCVCVCLCLDLCIGVVVAAQNTCLIFKIDSINIRLMKITEFNRLEYPFFLYSFFKFYLFCLFIWIYWLLSILVHILVFFFLFFSLSFQLVGLFFFFF